MVYYFTTDVDTLSDPTTGSLGFLRLAKEWKERSLWTATEASASILLRTLVRETETIEQDSVRRLPCLAADRPVAKLPAYS